LTAPESKRIEWITQIDGILFISIGYFSIAIFNFQKIVNQNSINQNLNFIKRWIKFRKFYWESNLIIFPRSFDVEGDEANCRHESVLAEDDSLQQIHHGVGGTNISGGDGVGDGWYRILLVRFEILYNLRFTKCCGERKFESLSPLTLRNVPPHILFSYFVWIESRPWNQQGKKDVKPWNKKL
jgi:hypothetical protein